MSNIFDKNTERVNEYKFWTFYWSYQQNLIKEIMNSLNKNKFILDIVTVCPPFVFLLIKSDIHT